MCFLKALCTTPGTLKWETGIDVGYEFGSASAWFIDGNYILLLQTLNDF